MTQRALPEVLSAPLLPGLAALTGLAVLLTGLAALLAGLAALLTVFTDTALFGKEGSMATQY